MAEAREDTVFEWQVHAGSTLTSITLTRFSTPWCWDAAIKDTTSWRFSAPLQFSSKLSREF
ncbi:hypothetical protein E2C01_012072 [Portunus trituberculatus]|uniref:Uncharacterized protein n=1 Tax=Portunus trituberculatus TaxID=210409 RepID=A0A5B7DD21_PORTR|nr:hypothetical protein [Portunus trituberculatus]